jgi:hypothetical protein
MAMESFRKEGVVNPKCAKCGISESQRFRQLRTIEQAGGYVLWDDWPVLLYCERCRKYFCGDCQIDLGQTAGCPVGHYDLTKMRNTSSEYLRQ